MKNFLLSTVVVLMMGTGCAAPDEGSALGTATVGRLTLPLVTTGAAGRGPST